MKPQTFLNAISEIRPNENQNGVSILEFHSFKDNGPAISGGWGPLQFSRGLTHSHSHSLPLLAFLTRFALCLSLTSPLLLRSQTLSPSKATWVQWRRRKRKRLGVGRKKKGRKVMIDMTIVRQPQPVNNNNSKRKITLSNEAKGRMSHHPRTLSLKRSRAHGHKGELNQISWHLPSRLVLILIPFTYKSVTHAQKNCSEMEGELFSQESNWNSEHKDAQNSWKDQQRGQTVPRQEEKWVEAEDEYATLRAHSW